MSVCYFKILKIGSGPYVPYVQTVRQTNTFRRWQNSLGLIALLIVVYHSVASRQGIPFFPLCNTVHFCLDRIPEWSGRVKFVKSLKQFTAIADIPSRQRLLSSSSDDLLVPAVTAYYWTLRLPCRRRSHMVRPTADRPMSPQQQCYFSYNFSVIIKL